MTDRTFKRLRLDRPCNKRTSFAAQVISGPFCGSEIAQRRVGVAVCGINVAQTNRLTLILHRKLSGARIMSRRSNYSIAVGGVDGLANQRTPPIRYALEIVIYAIDLTKSPPHGRL
jgi:hypothetical protein